MCLSYCVTQGKHHQAYVNKLNDLVKESKEPHHETLESIIKFEKGPIYNQVQTRGAAKMCINKYI